MKEHYEYGARNGLCIWVSYGRVHKISFNEKNKEQTLERGTTDIRDFCYVLSEFMKNQAEHRPEEFMELYMGLTDDVEAKKIADEVYRTCIDKDRFPIETMKALANEAKTDKTIDQESEVNLVLGTTAWNCIVVKNGIVKVVNQGSNYGGRQVCRDNASFCDALYSSLRYYAETIPREFMNFYHAIKYSDKVAFDIAEKVRKGQIEETSSIFNV